MSLYDEMPEEPQYGEPDESCKGCEHGCPDCRPEYVTWYAAPVATEDSYEALVQIWTLATGLPIDSLDSALAADMRAARR